MRYTYIFIQQIVTESLHARHYTSAEDRAVQKDITIQNKKQPKIFHFLTVCSLVEIYLYISLFIYNIYANYDII